MPKKSSTGRSAATQHVNLALTGLVLAISAILPFKIINFVRADHRIVSDGAIVDEAEEETEESAESTLTPAGSIPTTGKDLSSNQSSAKTTNTKTTQTSTKKTQTGAQATKPTATTTSSKPASAQAATTKPAASATPQKPAGPNIDQNLAGATTGAVDTTWDGEEATPAPAPAPTPETPEAPETPETPTTPETTTENSTEAE